MKLKTFPEHISYLYEPTFNGIKYGFNETEICEKLYPFCHKMPDSYRYPGTLHTNEINQNEIKLLLDAINPIYEKWRNKSTLHYV